MKRKVSSGGKQKSTASAKASSSEVLAVRLESALLAKFKEILATGSLSGPQVIARLVKLFNESDEKSRLSFMGIGSSAGFGDLLERVQRAEAAFQRTAWIWALEAYGRLESHELCSAGLKRYSTYRRAVSLLYISDQLREQAYNQPIRRADCFMLARRACMLSAAMNKTCLAEEPLSRLARYNLASSLSLACQLTIEMHVPEGSAKGELSKSKGLRYSTLEDRKSALEGAWRTHVANKWRSEKWAPEVEQEFVDSAASRAYQALRDSISLESDLLINATASKSPSRELDFIPKNPYVMVQHARFDSDFIFLRTDPSWAKPFEQLLREREERSGISAADAFQPMEEILSRQFDTQSILM